MSLDSELNIENMLRNLDILTHFDGVSLPEGMEVIKKGGGKDHVPLFFAATHGDDLYICVRGATDANDFQIVFHNDNVDFLDGKAHKGILSAARSIIEQLDAEISKTKGKIFAMGHSLGAATTIAVSGILRLEKNMENVFCYNFAQFPVFSKTIADKTRDWMTSVIYGNDIVPKLTTQNLVDLFRTMTAQSPSLEEGIKSVKTMVEGLMKGVVEGQGVTDPQELNAVINVLSENIDRIVQMSQLNDFSDTPTLSGKLFHIVPQVNHETNQTTYNVVPYVLSNRIDFFGIMFGVQQHYIKFYHQTLHHLCGKKPEVKPAPTPDDDLD
jgi:hypothetical protein